MDPKTTLKSDAGNEVEEQDNEQVVAPPRSSHVIDLRQGGAKTPPRHLARPAASDKPARPVAKADAPKADKPVATPEPEEELFDGDVLSSPQNKRRFWPAFARFLALLILLGLILAGGVYLYLKYFQS